MTFGFSRMSLTDVRVTRIFSRAVSQTSDSRTRARISRLISAGKMLSTKIQRHSRSSSEWNSRYASAASR